MQQASQAQVAALGTLPCLSEAFWGLGRAQQHALDPAMPARRGQLDGMLQQLAMLRTLPLFLRDVEF